MASNHNDKPLIPMTPRQQRAMKQAQLSRRQFLAQTGGASAVLAQTGVAGAQATPGASPVATPGATPVAPPPMAEEPWPGIGGPPPAPDQQIPERFQALTDQEAAVIEALTARILPGTPEDPGAREAGVVYYIDYALSNNDGLNRSVYLAGPAAQAYEGDEPPEEEENIIWVTAEDISRYGYQSLLTPLEIFQHGVEIVERHAQETYGSGVTDLNEDDQDQIIWALLRDEVSGFERMSGPSFFLTLRQYTSEGMFSDPAYGGNRDMVGWTLVGFPGSQRAYSPDEMLTEQEPREPQSLGGLPHFNPGVPEDGEDENPILPVRGPENHEGKRDLDDID